MAWAKGQSGNPGGRPKGEAKVREAAQAAGPKALAVLIDALADVDARVRLKAAEILLDRGFGKPQQSISAEVSVGLSSILESLPVKSRPDQPVDC